MVFFIEIIGAKILTFYNFTATFCDKQYLVKLKGVTV